MTARRVGPASRRAVPLVTVGVACHNGADHLTEALRSATAQTHENLEILVVDDGSTDGSAELAASLGDDRIRVVRRSENRGVSRTRQEIADRAGGEYLVWLDADDRFDTERVERLLAAALDTGADLVIDTARYVDETGHPLPGARSVPDHVATDDHFTRLFERNTMPPHPLVSRRCTGIGFDPNLTTSEDYDVWLMAVRAGLRFLRIDSVGMDYRIRAGSLSSDPAASRAALRRILYKHAVDDIIALYRQRGFPEPIVDQMACLQWIHRGDVARADGYARRTWLDEPGVDRDFYAGTLALELGDHDRAEYHLSRHLERDPDSPAGLNNLGVLIDSRGGCGDELWSRALQIFPGYVDAEINLTDRAAAGGEGRRSATRTQLDRHRPR